MCDGVGPLIGGPSRHVTLLCDSKADRQTAVTHCHGRVAFKWRSSKQPVEFTRNSQSLLGFQGVQDALHF
jgi:hypothetical protein